MGISSIVQLANRLLNGESGQDAESRAKTKNTQAASQAQNNRTEFGDRFTPSARGDSANAAGGIEFLQVEQLRFTAVNIQTGATAAATVAAAPGPASTVAPPVATLNPLPTATIAAAPVATTASPVQTQQDLQALNASLTALGLNAAEIAAFDQFAGVLLQFDPNVLQDLQNQLNLLAARFQAQSAAPAAAAQAPSASPNFQLTELSISFSGLNGTITQGNGSGTATQFSAFTLQIQEVRVTLSNPTGETAQLKVPQAGTATTATVAPASSAARA